MPESKGNQSFSELNASIKKIRRNTGKVPDWRHQIIDLNWIHLKSERFIILIGYVYHLALSSMISPPEKQLFKISKQVWNQGILRKKSYSTRWRQFIMKVRREGRARCKWRSKGRMEVSDGLRVSRLSTKMSPKWCFTGSEFKIQLAL